MTVCTATFERGSVPGAAVSTSDVGTATAWDSVDAPGGSITYDNVHARGGLSGKYDANAAGAASVSTQWDTAFGTQTDHYGRVYIYLSALPTGTIRLVEGGNPSTTFRISILTSGLVNVAGNGGSALGNFTTAVSTGQWVRLEWHVVHSATGSAEVKLFNDANSATPTETQTFSSVDTGTSATRVTFGWGSGSSGGATFWLDNIVEGGTAYPGPVTGMSRCTATFERGTNGAEVVASDPGAVTAWDGKIIGGGSMTYSNVQHQSGAQSMYVNGLALGSTKAVWWSTAFGISIEHYGRFYLYTTNNALADTYLMICRSGATAAFSIRHLLDQRIRILGSLGELATSTITLPLNQWVRFEYHVIHNTSTGFAELKIFTNPNSFSPTETLVANNVNTGEYTDVIYHGHVEGCDPPYSNYFDNIVAGALSYLGPVGTYSDTILADAPMVYWKLDETSGSFVDAAGNTAAATAYGDPYDYRQISAVGEGASIYNDTNSRAATSTEVDFTDPNIWTLEVWIRTSGTGTSADGHGIIEMANNSPVVRVAGTNAGTGQQNKIELVKSFAAADGSSTITVDDNQWHYIIARRTGGVSQIFIDAVDRTGTMTNPDYANNDFPTGFGAQWSGSGTTPSAPHLNSEFKGSLDELAIYNYALTDAQILAHYQRGLAGRFGQTPIVQRQMTGTRFS